MNDAHDDNGNKEKSGACNEDAHSYDDIIDYAYSGVK